MYRNKQLLEVVREAPICFGCGRHNTGTIVAAHSNQGIHGKGKAIKSDDCYIAALCYECHSAIDQGKDMTKEERYDMWNTACILTYGWLMKDGRLKLHK
jgi:hypothetical protein